MTLDSYNPNQAPDPEAWLALPEDERLALIEDWHDATGEHVGRAPPAVHAAMHVIGENQIALGNPPLVAIKLRQLMGQGLSRHDALHAIASVLIRRMNAIVKRPTAGGDPNANYVATLRRLNAQSWRRSG